MVVFISWSGDTSRKIAKTLRKWLPQVIQSIDPWMSEEDIEKGRQGNTEIASALKNAKFGVICLTPDNLKAPWILFEAGALAKSLSDSFIVPALFQVSVGDLPGPLAQFQATSLQNKEDVKLLLRTLNNAIAGESQKGLTEQVLERAFNNFWPQLQSSLDRIAEARKEIQSVSATSSSIRVYPDWGAHRISDTLSSVSETIAIVDSWYGESQYLAGCIKASKSRKDRLEIKVYMLDPDGPYGAQRYSEWAGVVNATEEMQVTYREKFRGKFNDTITTLRRHTLGIAGIELSFFRYATMPKLRLFIVDDKEFLFGWFPLLEPSYNNVCFHVSSTDSPLEPVVSSLRDYYNAVHSISELIQ